MSCQNRTPISPAPPTRRQTNLLPTTPASAAPPKPAVSKPVAKPTAKGKERRFIFFAFFTTLFGTWAASAWTAFTASMGLMSLGTLRFLYPNVLSEPPSKIKVGFPDNYEEGKVVERYKDQNTWVVRKNGVDLRPEHHLHPSRLHA